MEVFKVGESYNVSTQTSTFPAELVATGTYENKPVVALKVGDEYYLAAPEFTYGKGTAVKAALRLFSNYPKCKSLKELVEGFTLKISPRFFSGENI